MSSNYNDLNSSNASLTDQIFDVLFSSLENEFGFDANLINRLHELARREELSNSRKVKRILKTTQGNEDEIA